MSADAPAPPRRRIPRSAIVLALAVVVLLALRAALPVVAQRALESELRTRLQADVEVDDVDFSLLEGSVAVEGFALGRSDGSHTWLTGRRLAADVDWGALVRGELALESVELEGAQLSLVRRADGGFELPRLAEGTEDEAPEPVAEEPAPGPPRTVTIEELALRDVQLALRDDADAREIGLSLGALGLGPLVLEIGDPFRWSLRALDVSSTRARLENDDRSEIGVDLSVRVDRLGSGTDGGGRVEVGLGLGDGRFDVRGTVAPDPLELDLAAEWKDLDLAQLVALAPETERPTVRSGRTRGALKLATSLRGPEADATAAELPEALLVSGELAVSDLDADVEGGPPLTAAWKQLALRIDSIRVPLSASGPVELSFGALDLDAPRIRVERPAPTDSGEEPGAPSEAAGAEGGESSGDAGVRVALDRLDVSDGRLVVDDATFDPPLEIPLSGISIEGRGLRWPGPIAESLSLRIASLGRKPLALDGRASERSVHATLDATRVSLLLAEPYVRQASDYAITQGEISLHSVLDMKGKAYEAPTKVVLHDLEVDGSDAGARFQKDFGVSLELALALLRNPSGDIVLDLPIEDPGTGAGVGFVTVLTNTFRRVLLNALAAPLSLARGLLPKEGDASFAGRAFFFPPGGSELEASEGDAEADAVGRLLRESPGLAVRMEAFITDSDWNAVSRGAGFEAGTAEAPSDAALDRLGRLAAERLEVVRRRIVESLSDVPDVDTRVLAIRWKRAIADGRPRVLARVALRAE